MTPDDFFAAEYESRCTTPAARYADGQCAVSEPGQRGSGNKVFRVCARCGRPGTWASRHTICGTCRTEKRRQS